MSSTRPKEELIIHAGSAKGSWEIQIAVGLWEERWSQSPFFLSSCKLKIAGYLDFGKTFQSWIVFFVHYPRKTIHTEYSFEWQPMDINGDPSLGKRVEKNLAEHCGPNVAGLLPFYN